MKFKDIQRIDQLDSWMVAQDFMGRLENHRVRMHRVHNRNVLELVGDTFHGTENLAMRFTLCFPTMRCH
ncbi:hypothetical protein D3C86_1979410 [compost metagenome]